MGALSIRHGIAHTRHLLRVRVIGDSNPSSSIRIGVDRWPTQLIRAEHLNRTRLDLLTNYRKILGANCV